MTKEELIQLEADVKESFEYRRRLGGYDANAEAILKLTEWMLKLVEHEREKARR